MKLIVNTIPKKADIIELEDVHLDGGKIIGCVYNGGLAILNYNRKCFFSLSGHNEHSSDTNIINCLIKNLNNETKLYVFDDLQDLAKAIIEHGWKCW